MRRLVLLSSMVVFADVSFYTAITPLLPHYVHELDLSKAQAGLLYASYAGGSLAASLPAGFLAARIGPRQALVFGLLLFGSSSLVFGFAHQGAVLDLARFAQGIAGAITWASSLAWLIPATPVGLRGSVIGSVFGAAVAGALLGPALGALASELGTGPVFSSVLVVSGALALVALRTPEHGRGVPGRPRDVWTRIASRPVLLATWYVAVPSTMFGVVNVLIPLRIHALGGGAGVVAAGFMAAAGLEAVLTPLAGRFSDRVGRMRPYTIGLLICAIAIAAILAIQTLGPLLGALVCVSLGASFCFAPALTMLSDAAEATGLHQGLAFGLTNMAWSLGLLFGGLGGGAAASVTDDALPYLLVVGLLLATAWAAGGATESRGATAEHPT